MSRYTADVLSLEQKYIQAQQLRDKVKANEDKLSAMNHKYQTMLEAQALLSTVSDENTTAVLDYITGIVNKTLSELFPHDTRRVYLEKSLYQGKTAHINVKLIGTNGKTRDMTLQTGTGLRQVISWLYLVSMIEIRKGRRLLIADELLNGLHPEAKRIVFEIMQLFAEDGFQFIFVEYGVNTVGKIYLVEKPGDEAKVTPLDADYKDEVFIFNHPAVEFDISVREEVAEE